MYIQAGSNRVIYGLCRAQVNMFPIGPEERRRLTQTGRRGAVRVRRSRATESKLEKFACARRARVE